MQAEEIARIVGEVLKRLETQGGLDLVSPKASLPAPGDDVVYATVDAAVSAAARAQKDFQDQGLEVRKAAIKAMRRAAIANAERWGRMAQPMRGSTRMSWWLGRWPACTDLTHRAARRPRPIQFAATGWPPLAARRLPSLAPC